MVPLTAAAEAPPPWRQHAPALVPGILIAALFVDWAVQDGGYDASTWYWGALLALSALALVVAGPARRRARLEPALKLAIVALALYVAWSYLSIAWAQAPGTALEGSNRALLYLILFSLAALLPWTPEAALTTLTAFVIGIGAVALVLLVRFAHADQVANLIVNGRLEAPTGYFNATAALFTLTALVSIELASRRALTPPLRALLLGIAAAVLQLAVTAASRGWLFTLPIVGLVALVVVRDRARFVLAAAFPAVATVVSVHRLLAIYDARTSATALAHAATRAGDRALLTSALVIAVATVICSADVLMRPPAWVLRSRRAISAAAVAFALAAAVIGGLAATHGDPFGYLSRQWHGFSHPEQASTGGSRFEVVGSGRYDFWRVALDGLRSNPIGGLGQDNYADYYVRRRHTTEEAAWPHSFEMRLLVMTGIVGLLAFVVFATGAVVAALRRRTAGGRAGWLVGASLLPFVVWLIHGSVDWFWEMPCLAGPALAFLAMAGSIGSGRAAAAPAGAAAAGRRWPRPPRPALVGLGVVALVAACIVLAFPYLSVVEQSRATRETGNPVRALSDLATAAELDPLSPIPGRLAGDIALQNQQYEIAQQRFRQSIQRDPGGWFAWLGAGLAASALGEVARAHRDFQVAASINDQQPAVTVALARVGSSHPLTPSQAFQMLVVVQ